MLCGDVCAYVSVWPVCGCTGNYDRGPWIYVAYNKALYSVIFARVVRQIKF